MFNLLIGSSESQLPNKLGAVGRDVRIVASPKFVVGLHQIERQHRCTVANPDALWPLRMGTFRRLDNAEQDAQHGETTPTFVVADPEGETARVQALTDRYPSLEFVGLAEDVFPALLAGAADVFRASDEDAHAPTEMVLVFATPRSGSSALADVVSAVTGADCREHLRPYVLEALRADYRFDRTKALNKFLRMAQRDGIFATKVISHFLIEYFNDKPAWELLAQVASGTRIRVACVDRRNRLEQGISGEVAARRGIYHARSERGEQEVRAAGEVSFNFNAILKRKLRYEMETAVLDLVRTMWPSATTFVYEDDIYTESTEQTVDKVLKFLSRTEMSEHAKDGSSIRRKLPGDTNAQLREMFEARWTDLAEQFSYNLGGE